LKLIVGVIRILVTLSVTSDSNLYAVMSKNTNPIILFAGGLILGVLIAMGFIMRMKDTDTASISVPRLSNYMDKLPTVDSLVSNFDRVQSVVAVPTTEKFKQVETSPNLHSTAENIGRESVTSVTTTALGRSVGTAGTHSTIASGIEKASAPTIKSRPKWAPGKPGAFSAVDSTAPASTTPAVPGTSQVAAIASPPLSIKEQKQQKRLKVLQSKQLADYIPGGAVDGVVPSKKQLKAAMMLKRQQQQQQQQQGNNNLPSVTASNTRNGEIVTTTSARVAVNPSIGQVVSTTENYAEKSIYSSKAIEKAMREYHAQSERDYTGVTPYIPSYSAAAAANKPLPNMALQKGEFEKENLKLHLCNSVYEAYSASYLTTKHHMLEVASETYNLTWVNCEMASFIHMKASSKFYHNPNQEGLIMQSLDVLDFSVIHLSAYERSSNKHRNALWKNRKDMVREWANIDPVISAGKRLAYLNDPRIRSISRNITYLPEAQRTVVVMPFLGGAMGAGHSKLNNRYEYLKTCFWSLYEFFPHIVAGVTRQEDVDWCLKESGMPFYEVLLMPKLPKSAGLPVGLTQQTKLRLQDGRWDFDYVFFTESDQILITRELPMMYSHLKKYPGHMILPHRLMPYSNRVIGEVHKRDMKPMVDGAWATQSCCLPRQNCQERKTWLPIADPGVPVINYYGLYVPLGNVNFLAESYRSCKLVDYVGKESYCP